MSETETIVGVIGDGGLAVLPTDTVYGLVCTAFHEQAALDLYRLKGRDAIQPTAVLFATVDVLLECLPELRGRSAAIVRAVLPGPYTLVVPNPAGRFRWLCQNRPDTIGVRVPILGEPTVEILARLRAVVATSANLPGGPAPRRLTDVPEQILAGVAAAQDGGELPGTPSTVIDVTGPEPVILRDGAGDPGEVLARVPALHT